MSRDDGVAAVWVLALSLVLVALLGAGSVAADLLAARQRAAAAADLGALAGAPAAAWSELGACQAASSVVRANAASVHDCRVEAGDVWVTASAQPRSHLARWLSDVLLQGTGPRVSAHAGLR
ncbi:MAG: Rv3654c family TadE-like protein [Candidatus Nanopelagicales bacterium]